MVQWVDICNKLIEMNGVQEPFHTYFFYISLNYGGPFMEGKHQNTLQQHWEMFHNAILNNEPNTEERCLFLFGIMNQEQKDILFYYLDL